MQWEWPISINQSLGRKRGLVVSALLMMRDIGEKEAGVISGG